MVRMWGTGKMTDLGAGASRVSAENRGKRWLKRESFPGSIKDQVVQDHDFVVAPVSSLMRLKFEPSPFFQKPKRCDIKPFTFPSNL